MKLFMDRGRMLAELSAAARNDPTKSTEWYRIRNAAGEGPSQAAEVVIYSDIGYFGKTAADFMNELRGITAPSIDLRVNSPGGEIFDGIAIHNLLRSHPANVTAYVDSLAASIASVIVMAADKIVMMPHSQLMIHDGSGGCMGNAQDMREMADLLDRQSDNIAAVYAERAGGQLRGWRNKMKEETWYTAKEAVAAGLADEVANPKNGKGMPGMPHPEPEEPGEEEPEPGEEDHTRARWDLSVYAMAGLYRYAGREYAPAPVRDQRSRSQLKATSEEPETEEVEEEELIEEPAAEEQVEETEVEEAPEEPEVEGDPAPEEEEGEPEEPVITEGSWEEAVARLATPDSENWLQLVAHLTDRRPPARRHRTNA